MVYAGTQIYATIGPSRAAVDAQGDFWLLSHGKLHRFGPDGLRREAVDLEAIGAPPRPSDFDLHRDGRAVFADPNTSELVRCVLPRGPCERLSARTLSVPGQPILPLNAAKVHVDDAGGRYFVSDNAGHRVVILDFNGVEKARSPAGLLWYPNQLSLSAPDRLTVVDTNHHRLATFDLSQGLERATTELATAAPGVARPGRRWPFDAVRLPGGGTAVLVAGNAMRDGDLVFYEPGGRAVRRADLGADSDPFDVELWRGRLWVSDATRYRIDSVNLDGTPGAPLEDAAFAAELRDAAQVPERWKQVRLAAQLGLVGIPLLGAFLLWRLEKASPPQPAPRARQATTVWITPREALLRRIGWLANGAAWAVLLIIVSCVAIILLRFPVLMFRGSGMQRNLPTVLVLVTAAFAVFAAYRSIPRYYGRMRLALEPGGLRYEMPSAHPFLPRVNAGFARWSDVYADDWRLLAGNQLIVLRKPFLGALYPPETMAALLQAIPPGNRLTRSQLNARAWRAGAFRGALIIVAAGMVLGVLALALTRHLL